jgi:stress response protein SCP2
MTVELSKGSGVDLTKNHPALKLVNVGLGWDPVDSNEPAPVQEHKGWLGKAFDAVKGSAQNLAKQDIDIDASAFVIGANNKLKKLVYFSDMIDNVNSIRLSGDDLTGAAASSGNDNEIIYMDLSAIKQDVEAVHIWANIYECKNRNQVFGMVKNAFIRLVNRDTNEEVCRFNLSSAEYDTCTAIHMGSFVRADGGWKFNADGKGTTDGSLTEIKNNNYN